MPLHCHNEYMNYIEINYIKINYLILKKLIVYFWHEKKQNFSKSGINYFVFYIILKGKVRIREFF